MHDPSVSWAQRLSRKWFPSHEDRRRRGVQLAALLVGIVCIVFAFELMGMSVNPVWSQESFLAGPAPIGFLLLFVGVSLSLVGFGYLVSPLKPWQTASDEYGDISTLPSRPGVDSAKVAQQARVAFILILLAGLILLEALPMYNIARSNQLFDRTNCVYNCQELTKPEIAFLLDLIPIAIANVFVAIMLFVYIQP